MCASISSMTSAQMADQPARPAESVVNALETFIEAIFRDMRYQDVDYSLARGEARDVLDAAVQRLIDGIAPTGLIDEPALNDGDCQ